MVSHKILVKGSNFKFVEGTIGFANLVLVETPDGPILFDTGHYGNRRHLLAGRSAKQKRNLRHSCLLTPDDAGRIKYLLPYGR